MISIPKSALLLSLISAIIPSEADDGDVEISFGPADGQDFFGMGASDGKGKGKSGNMKEADLDKMFSSMFGGAPVQMIGDDGPQQRGRGGNGGKEADLDKMLSQMFGGAPVQIIGDDGPQQRGPGGLRGGRGGNPMDALFGGARGSQFSDGTMEIEGGGPGSPQIIEFSSGPMSMQGMQGSPGGLPAGLLRDLFPGPMSSGRSSHAQPFDKPDPAVQDLMSDMDQMFANTILPMVQKSASADRAPNACKGDLKAHCSGPDVKSQIHCLGQHQGDISQACHKDVGKSVPFRCSPYIDKFCNLLEGGILSCLQSHLPELDDGCKDSVLATVQVITKAATETASVVDPNTGVKQISQPLAASASKPTVASMLSMAKKDGATRPYFMFGALIIVLMVATWGLTFTPYCPRQLRALLSPHAEKFGLLKGGVELPKPVDEMPGFIS